MTRARVLLTLLIIGVLQVGTAGRASAGEPVRVVYHLVDGVDQAARALANIRNHLRAESDARIFVVANNDGVRFLLAGARDRTGRSFEGMVEALSAQGVTFLVCATTLAAHQVPVEQLMPQAKLVQSGVAEIARLQFREGFAYLRP